MTSRISVGALTTMLATALFFTASAAVDPAFQVGKWANFCQGAVSHTFDDNTQGQINVAQPLFDAKGFHMTFFLVINWSPTWSSYKTAFSKGHEIASHSVSHPDGAIAASELAPSQKTIKQNVPGEKCATIAYPNCKMPSDDQNGVQVLKTYIAGRTCSGSIAPATPSDFSQISSFIVGSAGNIKTATDFNNKENEAATNGGWAVFCHHGVGASNDHNYSVTATDALSGNLNFLDQNRGKIWCETFGNVARYIKERDAASVTVKSTSADSIVVSVTDNLADSIFNYPLTLRRELPSGWTKATVTQKGVVVKDTIVINGGKSYIQFQAVPDSGDVVIKSGTVAVIKKAGAFRTNNASPVERQNATLVIDTRHFNGSNLNVTLFNLNGKAIAHYNLGANESNVALPMEKIGNSAFIVKIKGGSKSFTGKFMASL